jgi:hypothetical protein
MHATRTRSSESGMSLVVTLLIVMAVLGLGMAAVWYASLQIGAARNLNSRQTALNAAHAGVQHARAVLATTPFASWGSCLQAHLPTTDGGTSADDVPDQTHPARKGVVLFNSCVAPGGSDCTVTGPLVTCPYAVNGGDAGLVTLGTYTVWIRNNQGQILSGLPTTPNYNGVIVRAEGKDLAGTSTVVVEASLAQSVTLGVDINKYAAGKAVNAFSTGSAAGAVNWGP